MVSLSISSFQVAKVIRGGSIISLACFLSGLLISQTALAQAASRLDENCEIVNTPADSGFDFTEAISRWGTRDSFDIDNGHYHVRSIVTNQLPIFDETNPDENISLYRWVNRIHLDTKPGVIRNQLLFEPGEEVDSQMLSESERLLRNQKYVAESKLRVLRKCGDTVDLEAVTREVWTMTPDISFHTSGGDTNFQLGVRDTNFLGTGQRVNVSYTNDPERTSYGIFFEHPDFRARRRVLKLAAADNSDGSVLQLQYAQPFFSLDSRHAWDLNLDKTDEVLTQYRWGDRITEVDHSKEIAEFSWGFSPGLQDQVTQRYSFGFRHENHRYGPGIERPSPALLPADISLNYPFVQYERVEDNYAVGYNISQIYRTEDLHIGSWLTTSLGYSPGGDGQLIFSGLYRDTLLFRPKMLLQWHADWYGRLNQRSGDWEDTVASVALDFHRGQTENRTLYMGLAATHAINLNASQQVFLGGSTGLRGYDSHYLNGDSAVRFSIEERLFTRYHLFQLLRVGVAGFYDVGRVFGSTEPNGNDLYQNVGFGLRLSPSKSDKGKVIHVDIAYPLNNHLPGGRTPQLVLEARESF
ncbi:MAG: hypothetical protein R3F41_12600 [Gammaproteobacteria bacterium]|nr:hypothetical protein [Pseudomonadales bacterium]MCP5348937.1 hypothetical protein [Pseudomonadales bacterium]